MSSPDNVCKGLNDNMCARYNRSCRWQKEYVLKGKNIPASCRKARKSKSPKKAAPKRMFSVSPKPRRPISEGSEEQQRVYKKSPKRKPKRITKPTRSKC